LLFLLGKTADDNAQNATTSIQDRLFEDFGFVKLKTNSLPRLVLRRVTSSWVHQIKYLTCPLFGISAVAACHFCDNFLIAFPPPPAF
jgi:hypothetical protein